MYDFMNQNYNHSGEAIVELMRLYIFTSVETYSEVIL